MSIHTDKVPSFCRDGFLGNPGFIYLAAVFLLETHADAMQIGLDGEEIPKKELSPSSVLGRLRKTVKIRVLNIYHLSLQEAWRRRYAQNPEGWPGWLPDDYYEAAAIIRDQHNAREEIRKRQNP